MCCTKDQKKQLKNDGRRLLNGWKREKLDQFEIEAKTSGGAVFELGVKTSKHDKAVRRLAQPLMDKYWKNTGQSVTTLHRVYRVAEYLLKRSQRYK